MKTKGCDFPLNNHAIQRRMTRFIASKDPRADAAIYDAARNVAWSGQSLFEAAEGALLRESLRRHGTQSGASKALRIYGSKMNRLAGTWGMQDKQLP